MLGASPHQAATTASGSHAEGDAPSPAGLRGGQSRTLPVSGRMTADALEVVFWTIVALMAWPVVGYPLVLLVLAAVHRRRRPAWPPTSAPSVSIILTMVHGERGVSAKLRNTLFDVDWEGTTPEVIVVVDGGPLAERDEVARLLADRPHRVIERTTRTGKDACQYAGIAAASGELLVFTDVTTMLDRDAIRQLLMPFADPHIGCVSSNDQPVGGGGEGMYVRFEMRLRSLESELFGLIGASGCLFAVRRVVATWWNGRGASDFALPILAAQQGLRTVHAPQAIGRYVPVRSARAEFRRKRRTIVHGMLVLSQAGDALNPFRHGRLFFQLLSHKLLRWVLPMLLLASALAAIPLRGHHALYAAWPLTLLAIVTSGTVLTLLGDELINNRVTNMLRYATLSTTASLLAWWDLLRGQTHDIWSPSRTSEAL